MQDSFRLTGGSAGVENEKRMFTIELGRGALIGNLADLFVPPEVAAAFHFDIILRTLEHDDFADRFRDGLALDLDLQRVVDVLLQRDNAATPETANLASEENAVAGENREL